MSMQFHKALVDSPERKKKASLLPPRTHRYAPPIRLPQPLPWTSETVDLAREKNFFETRVTEYQSASALSWD
jgi:hypothetical protein